MHDRGRRTYSRKRKCVAQDRPVARGRCFAIQQEVHMEYQKTRRDFLRHSLAAAATCTLAAPAPGVITHKKSPFNVLWIVIDAARARNFELHGYPRKTCPALTHMAREGVVFERAFSQAFWTSPSVSSYMTGQYFPRWITPVMNEAKSLLLAKPENEPIAPALFSAHGYNTIMFSANRGYVRADSRLGKAFDTTEYIPAASWPHLKSTQGAIPKETFREAVTALSPWLRTQNAGSRPFFAYVHAMDTHGPYVVPNRAPFNQWLVEGYSGKWVDRFAVKLDPWGNEFATAEDREQLWGLYDGAILHADYYIAALLEELEASGLAERTIVVVTSDHGEALLENGRNHGHTAQLGRAGPDETFHVPLVIRGPGIAKGERVAAQVECLDILPTLLDLCGLPIHPAIDGLSLAALARGQDAPAPHPFVLAKLSSHDLRDGGEANLEDTAQVVLRGDAHKVLWDRGTPENDTVWRVPDQGDARCLVIGDEAEEALEAARHYFLQELQHLEDKAQTRIPPRAIVASLGSGAFITRETRKGGRFTILGKETVSLDDTQRGHWLIDQAEPQGAAFVCTHELEGEGCKFNLLRVIYGHYRMLLEVFAGTDRWGLRTSRCRLTLDETEPRDIKVEARTGGEGWRWVDLGVHEITQEKLTLHLDNTGHAVRLRRLVLFNDVPGAEDMVKKHILGNSDILRVQESRQEDLEALGYL